MLVWGRILRGVANGAHRRRGLAGVERVPAQRPAIPRTLAGDWGSLMTTDEAPVESLVGEVQTYARELDPSDPPNISLTDLVARDNDVPVHQQTEPAMEFHFTGSTNPEGGNVTLRFYSPQVGDTSITVPTDEIDALNDEKAFGVYAQGKLAEIVRPEPDKTKTKLDTFLRTQVTV